MLRTSLSLYSSLISFSGLGLHQIVSSKTTRKANELLYFYGKLKLQSCWHLFLTSISNTFNKLTDVAFPPVLSLLLQFSIPPFISTLAEKSGRPRKGKETWHPCFSACKSCITQEAQAPHPGPVLSLMPPGSLPAVIWGQPTHSVHIYELRQPSLQKACVESLPKMEGFCFHSASSLLLEDVPQVHPHSFAGVCAILALP